MQARGKLIYKLADLMEKHADELAALETLVRRFMGTDGHCHCSPAYFIVTPAIIFDRSVLIILGHVICIHV